ncbi:MAG: 23S rRNA (uracil1939-C5)-methyltransferase [Myxococcota bacterium]|jgi:23S rRNA (uracil1939-C5)-methyltransferase
MEALPCPIAEICGGCPAMAQPADAQQTRRRDALARAMGRPPDHVIPSPRSLGYRARVLLRPGPDGQLGYHPRRSNTPLPIDRCPVARDEISAVIAALGPVPPALAGVELRSDGAKVVLSALTNQRHGRQRGRRRGTISTDALLQATEGAPLAGVALDGRTLRGDVHTHLIAGGIAHQLHPLTFYQVNLEINEWLVDTVRALVTELSPAGVLDLYSGAGNLSLPLAAAGIPVTLIEQSPTAVSDAKATAKRLGLTADIRRGDAGSYQAGDTFFEVVVLDPPRAGAPGVLAQLIVTRPRRIIYVSCNPTALARDIRPALSAGYRLVRLDSLDMFPQTHHAEALCVLDR